MTTVSRTSSHGSARPAPARRSSIFCRREAPEMPWLALLADFFGGLFLANAIPHLVSGMMGRPFQSPFAKPPGEGLSSSTVNVVWGAFNVAVGYLLVCQVGAFDLRNVGHVAV